MVCKKKWRISIVISETKLTVKVQLLLRLDL
jgi:hypothetical protein